jgi:diguanylate cyclase (GGDEF)-like protein
MLRLGQANEHSHSDKQLLKRVNELKQRALLSNLEQINLAHTLAHPKDELDKAQLAKTQAIEKQTFLDELTGLLNVKAFSQELDFEVKRALRYKRPLSLCLLTIDNLSTTNREYGMLTVDIILKATAVTLSSALRETDIACRYTSEHFAIAMPDTGAKAATIVAARIQKRLRKLVIKQGTVTLRVTASIGLANLPEQMRDREELVAGAYLALQKASAEGGNNYLLVEKSSDG